MKELTNIKYWLFDLDNTLYSGDTKVFDQVDKKMSKFISEKLNVSLVEAKKILRERAKNIEAKGKIILQTGYGPSGLPHIGTFGEVARTSMIVNALNQLCPTLR